MKKIIITTIFILLSIASTCFAFEPPNGNYFLLDYKEDFYYFYVNKASLCAAKVYQKDSPLYNDRLFIAMTKSYMPAFGTYDMSLWEIDIDKRLSRQRSRVIFDEKTSNVLSTMQPEKYFSEIPVGSFLDDLYLLGCDMYDDLMIMQMKQK